MEIVGLVCINEPWSCGDEVICHLSNWSREGANYKNTTEKRTEDSEFLIQIKVALNQHQERNASTTAYSHMIQNELQLF